MATATAATTAPPPLPAQVDYLEPSEISPSPTNPRKTFERIAELAANFRVVGVIQPITVRPAPKGAKTPYQIVVGERRWRAAQEAPCKLPSLIREMTDEQVAEAQLVENGQREDVHPLEEADTFRRLIDEHKYTAESIASKTGKSRATIYARLKLCALAPAPRKALLEGKLDASVALLIARIPDAKLQSQATDEVLGRGDWQDYRAGGVPENREIKADKEAGIAAERVPLSVREAQVHLQRRYMLRLEQAPFDSKDATLTKAGACTPCTKRTGNQVELFSDVKRPDVCTDPNCYQEKTKADWERKAAAATRAGARVLNEKETKNVFADYGDGTRIQNDSAYVDPSDSLPYSLDPTGKKTWKSMLGTEAGKVAKAVARDSTGAARELLDKKSALAVATKAGKIKEAKNEAKARVGGDSKYRSEEAKRQAAAKRKHETVRVALAAIAAAVVAKGEMPRAAWAWFAKAIVRAVDAEDSKRVIRRRGLQEPEKKKGQNYSARSVSEVALDAWIDDTKRTSAELIGLAVELVASHRAVSTWSEGFGENFTGAVKSFGLDLKKLRAQAEKPPVDGKKRCGAKPGTGTDALGKMCLKPAGHEGSHMGAREVPWSDAPKPKKPAGKGGKS
jgi:ParB/RepB/Spo0J family partition protein